MDETVHPESAPELGADDPSDDEGTAADALLHAGARDDVIAGETMRGGATVDEDPGHDCQVPREDAPAVGGEWKCPECGTWWRLESAEEHPEHLPEQREQRVNWYRVGKRAE